jgi:glycosyltransferase involved in cell wall biosynthesis
LILVLRIVFGNYELVHVHTPRVKILQSILFARRIKKFKLFFTDHNPRLFEGLTYTEIELVKRFLASCDTLIAVGPQIVDNYKKEGIYVQEKQLILNAFLPPPIDEEVKILHSYSAGFLANLEQRQPVIISNAYQLNFQDNIDLYGLDLCIELTKRLKQKFHNILFVFAIANDKYNAEYLSQKKSLITEYNLDDNFIFLTGQIEIWPLFKMADVFIRATYSDGYGISIDEALHFNCVAIASDVCTRNPQAILFNSRNIDDLYDKCLIEIDKISNPKKAE